MRIDLGSVLHAFTHYQVLTPGLSNKNNIYCISESRFYIHRAYPPFRSTILTPIIKFGLLLNSRSSLPFACFLSKFQRGFPAIHISNSTPPPRPPSALGQISQRAALRKGRWTLQATYLGGVIMRPPVPFPTAAVNPRQA